MRPDYLLPKIEVRYLFCNHEAFSRGLRARIKERRKDSRFKCISYNDFYIPTPQWKNEYKRPTDGWKWSGWYWWRLGYQCELAFEAGQIAFYTSLKKKKKIKNPHKKLPQSIMDRHLTLWESWNRGWQSELDWTEMSDELRAMLQPKSNPTTKELRAAIKADNEANWAEAASYTAESVAY